MSSQLTAEVPNDSFRPCGLVATASAPVIAVLTTTFLAVLVVTLAHRDEQSPYHFFESMGISSASISGDTIVPVNTGAAHHSTSLAKSPCWPRCAFQPTPLPAIPHWKDFGSQLCKTASGG